MGTQLAAAASQLGSPAAGEMNVSAPYTDDELQRRRSASRRLAWMLGLVVLTIYALGFFIQR